MSRHMNTGRVALYSGVPTTREPDERPTLFELWDWPGVAGMYRRMRYRGSGSYRVELLPAHEARMIVYRMMLRESHAVEDL